MKLEYRALQKFVEDLVSDGRDLEYILTVAFCTRWVDHTEEIKKVYRELRS